MKRFLSALIAILFVCAGVPCAVLAAGTVVETIHYQQTFDGEDVVVIKYAITADASAGTVPDTTIASWTVDDTDTRKQINLLNYYVYLVKTVPGAGGDAPDAYTVDIKDADASVVDIAARSTSAVEYVKGFDTLGVFPVVTGDMTLSVGDLGNSNKTTIYVYFLR